MIIGVQTNSYKSLSNSEKITDPAKVSRLLDRLSKKHTPLTVQVPGHGEHYTSYIVDIDKFVLLDELMPNTGHQKLLAERSLRVLAKLDGIDVQFITTLERVDEKKNELTYFMNLPKQIEYRQRRNAYRVHIPMSMILRVIIDDEGENVIEGVLHDLSHGGAGMIFPAGKPLVEPGLLQECAIELPNGQWLYSVVELRYSKSARSQDRQIIGAQFSGLSTAQERLVSSCIIELEREFIRKRAAD